MAPIGVFYNDIGGLGFSFYVLIPAKDPRTLIALESHLVQDRKYNEAGAPFLTAPSAQPAFERMNSALMIAFEGWPQLKSTSILENKKRIFELRTYESPSEQDLPRWPANFPHLWPLETPPVDERLMM